MRRIKWKLWGDSPFEDGDNVFYHSHGESKGSKEWNSGTRFEYRIDVGTTSVDPRIVGGGHSAQ